MAEFSGERGEGGGMDIWCFEVLFELPGFARALMEAEHAKRAGEFVRDGGGFLLEFGREYAGIGGCGCLLERGEALKDVGPTALPERSNLFLHGRLIGVVHVSRTAEIVNFLAGDG